MLPRILRHHRVLVYSHALAPAVDDCQLIPAESEWEIAIRWATVYACEELRLALCARGNQVTTPNLDYHLWHGATLSPHATGLGEHHRTVTLRY